MGELFAGIADLVFTVVVGYISAIEFLYVVRHLYHYSCNHASVGVTSNENLSQLQDSMRKQLANAKSKEALAGTQVMKDGVAYKEGFRLEEQQALIDQLKELLKNKELSDLRRQELEKELAKQTKIAEKLRKELAEAEAKYQRQLKQEEEAKAKKLLEEQRQREQEERARKEADEQARRLEEQRKREEEDRIRKEAEQKDKERREAEERKREEEERIRKEIELKDKERREAEERKEAEQRKREEEERIRKEAEQKEKERKLREEKERREAEDQAFKLAESERQREAEQRQREEAEENARRLQELEKQREIEQRLLEEREREEKIKAEAGKLQELAEAEENAEIILAKEKANEIKQAEEEAAAELATKRLLAIEHQLEEQLRAAELEAELTEREHQLIDSIKKRNLNDDEANEHREAELLRKILEARSQLGEESEEEQSLRLLQRERDQEAKQKQIEENALLFLEAEKEMADLQSKMLDAAEKKVFKSSLDSAPQTPIIEEPCIKRHFAPLTDEESTHSTVKTQLAQDFDEPYTVRTKPLLFPGVSDDASSIDPASSQKSSFSTQPSEEITTGTDSQYPHLERQEPDGEDNNLLHHQYSDDYLRSLDGIKQRPLVREDGSGRRRAFKKRRSSNSSNSSRESRLSRDEELKMFTSLEEEEMKDTADSEFTPIRYSTDPSLKVKGHHRRHKRSPAKDMRRGDDSLRSSLERLGEETSDPWGELKPEHYKHTEFWKREKTLSIDEETEFEKPISSEETAYNTATNLPSASSFEEATQKQNQEALSTLQKYSAQRNSQGGKSDQQTKIQEDSARSGNTNLQTSISADNTISAHSTNSPHLRLSSRKEEENKSVPSSAQNTPIIKVETPLDFGPWRDQYGLVMEGLSDFYDFTASVNPSRSRSASRNVSPANTAPNTPSPKDVSFQLNLANEKVHERTTVEIYDDANGYIANEFRRENIIKFIDALSGKEEHPGDGNEVYKTHENEVEISKHLKNIADDPSSPGNQASLVPLVNIVEESAGDESPNLESDESSAMSTNTLVSTLRSHQSHKSRSRSKSPLPTADNLKRSVENRRYKMIKHNEDILEKLIESKLLPELTPPEEKEEESKNQPTKPSTADSEVSSEAEANPLLLSLQADKRRSRSKSPMRLPTPENLSKGLEKRRNKLIERNDELIKQLEERSQTPESPLLVVEHVYEFESSDDIHAFEQTAKTSSPNEEEEDNCTKEEMDLLVQSLRVARSNTRSKSPFNVQNIENITEVKTNYRQHNAEYIESKQHIDTSNLPTISIEFSEVEESSVETEVQEDCSREHMDLLVQSLRAARSRSTSRSPMRLPDSTLMQHMTERARTPEPSAISTIELVGERSRHSRSRSPSRSHSASPDSTALYRSNTPSRSLSPQTDEYNAYHTILTIGTDEQESVESPSRRRQLDEEALEKLRNASEEMELMLESDEFNEQQNQDHLADLPLRERVKLMKKTPTTPDYDRTISEEVRDNERIKQEMLKQGFKRSTYVGESMDLGSEFEPLRREAAKFQRSRSPSPSYSTIENTTAQRNAEEKRKIQDLILQELSTNTGSTVEPKEYKSTGAIPKTERFSSSEIEPSPNSEVDEIFNKNFQQLSTHSDRISDSFEEMRRRNAEFKRSASASRSPLHEAQKEELARIEAEAAKRGLKDKILDEVSSSSFKIQDISHNMNANPFNNDRRASDSALIKAPEILLQLNDDEYMEPEEYHHYRRFSLAQEQPQEQYPVDDYIFIQQVEVRTRSGSRTWLREDFYSENVEEYLKRGGRSTSNSVERENIETPSTTASQQGEQSAAVDEDEEYSNASDDDRQTVVEVDDEIDEDISDFNERGPAEESHHEISECEEAEREADRYAGREASDWNSVVDAEDVLRNENRANRRLNVEEDEGAVGGFSNSPYDSDSFAIDQIYDEAIKNRKQSGILREYDNILGQMSSSSDMDEQYLLWSKTNSKKTPKNIEFNTQFLDKERKEAEMRYLGDANTTARQSARLHSRYGYKPILQAKCLEDDLDVDLNYKPKKEYNWRKNFKLDDDAVKEDKEISLEEFYSQKEKYEHEIVKQWKAVNDNGEVDQTDMQQLNVAEENITSLDHSPSEKLGLPEETIEENRDLKNTILTKEEGKEEKPKKKKTKKKSHKESKATLEETMNREDEEAYDNQVYNRRSSSLQMETDSPKRKSRSRRSSKSSLTNEDGLGLFSPRSSVAGNENIEDIMEEYTEVVKEATRPKKMKKRKKVKEIMANVAESPIESREEIQFSLEALNDISPVSAAISPESSSNNILSTLSPQNSVCVTPASIDSDVNLSNEELRQTTASSSTTTTTTDSSPSVNLSRTSSITTTTPVDTFDILKDASFYPLF